VITGAPSAARAGGREQQSRCPASGEDLAGVLVADTPGAVSPQAVALDLRGREDLALQ
jgi:hypothetical protein